MGPWNNKKINRLKLPENNKSNPFFYFSRPLIGSASRSCIPHVPWISTLDRDLYTINSRMFKKIIHVTQGGHGCTYVHCLIIAYISFTNTYIYFPYFPCFEKINLISLPSSSHQTHFFNSEWCIYSWSNVLSSALDSDIMGIMGIKFYCDCCTPLPSPNLALYIRLVRLSSHKESVV